MDAFEVLKQMMLDNGHADWNEHDAEVMARNALDALDEAGFTLTPGPKRLVARPS